MLKRNREPYGLNLLRMSSIKDVEVKTSGGVSLLKVNPSEARVEVFINANNSSDDISKKDQKKAGRKLLTSMFLSTIIKYLLLLNLKKEHELKKS